MSVSKLFIPSFHDSLQLALYLNSKVGGLRQSEEQENGPTYKQEQSVCILSRRTLNKQTNTIFPKQGEKVSRKWAGKKAKHAVGMKY